MANGAEARNALARAVFFNRLGEMRDRSFENQRYRASGLTLLTAVIVLWNTVYLEKAIEAFRQHENLDEELLPHSGFFEAARTTWRVADIVGLGRMVLTYPELLWDASGGRAIQRKLICRTFSDCTTAPRNGLGSERTALG
jgi:hypothetical protein